MSSVYEEWPASEQVRTTVQLETTMRVLDNVTELRRELDALRSEIEPQRTRPAPGVVVRLAGECAVLVAVAVVAGVGQFRPLLTVVLMAAALAAVVVAELLASRTAAVPATFGFARLRPAVLDPPPESPLESDAWERPSFPETEPAAL